MQTRVSEGIEEEGEAKPASGLRQYIKWLPLISCVGESKLLAQGSSQTQKSKGSEIIPTWTGVPQTQISFFSHTCRPKAPSLSVSKAQAHNRGVVRSLPPFSGASGLQWLCRLNSLTQSSASCLLSDLCIQTYSLHCEDCGPMNLFLAKILIYPCNQLLR